MSLLEDRLVSVTLTVGDPGHIMRQQRVAMICQRVLKRVHSYRIEIHSYWISFYFILKTGLNVINKMELKSISDFDHSQTLLNRRICPSGFKLNTWSLSWSHHLWTSYQDIRCMPFVGSGWICYLTDCRQTDQNTGSPEILLGESCWHQSPHSNGIEQLEKGTRSRVKKNQ